MTVSIAQIAAALGAEALGDADLLVARPAEPATAGPDDLALAMSPKWADALAQGRASAALLWPGADWQALGLRAAICPPRARLAMARLTQTLDPVRPYTGLHATAAIAPSAVIARNTSVGAFCVIGEGARIGADSHIADHVSIEAGVDIGEGAVIHAGVRIGRGVRIGAGAILHPNAVIGADGFSFVTETPSNEERALKSRGGALLTPGDGTRHRIHSLGSVVLGRNVEVGANSTIDAGTIRPTFVGDGCKIDNLVQVGHNVVLGQDCVLCAQAAVAGSSRLGDRVVMGGKSGIKDNVRIGHDVVLGGGSIVLGPVPDGTFMMGHPAVPMTQYRRQQKALRQISVSNPGESD